MKNRGFTLIELLVVVSLIGMLSSIVLVSLQAARDKGRIASAIIFSTSMYRGWGADAFGVWNFDEANNGDNAQDQGAYGITLTKAADASVRSSVTPLSSGKSIDFTNSVAGDAASFTSGDISTKNISLTNYTVSLWIYLNDTSNSKGVPISVNTISGRAILFNLSTIDTTPFTLFAGPQLANCGGGSTSFSNKPSPQKWINYAFTWDKSTQEVRLYVDGKYTASLTGCNSSIGNGSWTAQSVYVGNFSAGASHFIKGLVDELAIYPSVLTASQIQEIYAQGLPRHIAKKD